MHLEIRHIPLWDTHSLWVFHWLNIFRAFRRPIREKASYVDCDHSEYCCSFPSVVRESHPDPLVCVDLLVWPDYSPAMPVVLCSRGRAHS